VGHGQFSKCELVDLFRSPFFVLRGPFAFVREAQSEFPVASIGAVKDISVHRLSMARLL